MYPAASCSKVIDLIKGRIGVSGHPNQMINSEVFEMIFGYLIRPLGFLAMVWICSISLFSSVNLIGESPYHGTTSVFVPYANSQSNPDLVKSPKINLGFNGSGHHVPFVMDTGSVGIIASPDHFTPAPGAQNLGPGRQYYSSSGIIEEGM
jgi:hypothetical protein